MVWTFSSSLRRVLQCKSIWSNASFFAYIVHYDLLRFVTERNTSPPAPPKKKHHGLQAFDRSWEKVKSRGFFRVKFASIKALFRGKIEGFFVANFVEERSVKNGRFRGDFLYIFRWSDRFCTDLANVFSKKRRKFCHFFFKNKC